MNRKDLIKRLESAARPTALDRVIGYVNPVAGERRQQARVKMEMRASVGGYVGAKRGRNATKTWSVSGGSAKADLHPDLEMLRERSRDLARNNPIAAGALSTVTGNVVGDGLRLKPEIDRKYLGMDDAQADEWEDLAASEFRLWSKNADWTGVQCFDEIQGLAFNSALENGDVAVLRRYRQEAVSPYGLRVHLIEADRICNPENRADGQEIAGGIEVDAHGRPVFMHILKAHPGENYYTKGSREWVRIPIYDGNGNKVSFLFFDRKRVDQVRGVPYLAAIIEPVKQIDRFTEAELMAAVVSAFFTVFIKTEGDEDFPDLTSDSASTATGAGNLNDVKMGSGTMLHLGGNESIEVADPKRPNKDFDKFFTAIIQQIGVALEIPYEVLMKSFKSSYSASRASLEQAYQFFKQRRTWMARNLNQQVYEWFLDEAVALGRLPAPGFHSDPAIRAAYCGAKWIGQARISLDPVKDANAAKLDMESGIRTGAEVTAERTGGDYEANLRQLGKEKRLRQEAGLETESKPPADPAGFLMPPDDDQDGNDNDDEDEDSNDKEG